MGKLLTGMLASFAATCSMAQLPIIDMHVHAVAADFYYGQTGAIDPFIGATSPPTDDALLRATKDALDQNHIVKAFLSGPLDYVHAWTSADPDRFIPAAFVGHDRAIEELDFGPPLTVEQLRREYDAHRLAGMGEIVAQYTGIAPNDPRLEPYFALAAEQDLPVLIHTLGLGAPSKSFRSSIGNPLLLEDVVARHPNLRIFIEDAGYPFLSETTALMTQYPQVYADLSTILRIIPVEEFHEYLRGLLRAGLGSRLMFGSDGGVWPQAITHAVRTVESVPFLTESQKRDIFYNNAARFLRLSEEEIARHHGR